METAAAQTPAHNDVHLDIQPKILYFGTPVVLVSTCNEDESPNLAAMSSAWALGWTVVLGLGYAGKTIENLGRTKECVLNLPSEDLWPQVERLATTTGKYPVPEQKRAQYRHERDKFGVAGLTPVPSVSVAPPRVAQCPLQMEARLREIHAVYEDDDDEGTAVAVVQVVRVHTHPDIVIGERHIDPEKWRPLIYNFRHYYGLGAMLGRTFKAEV